MKATKEEFVEKLSELLQMANIEVENARLVHGENDSREVRVRCRKGNKCAFRQPLCNDTGLSKAVGYLRREIR